VSSGREQEGGRLLWPEGKAKGKRERGKGRASWRVSPGRVGVGRRAERAAWTGPVLCSPGDALVPT
jgi:hypothetical protein